MRKISVVTLMALWFLSPAAPAKQVAGIEVPETVTVAGTPLLLNGAGVRRKFFFKIYVGALYLKNRQTTTDAVLTADNPKSVRMHFIYKKVSADKLVDAWNDGFKGNVNAKELAALKERIDRFNALFPAVRSGDTVRIDFLDDGTTEVWVNGARRGAIAGTDFQAAVLKIWLGDDPADGSLKRAMLGEQ